MQVTHRKCSFWKRNLERKIEFFLWVAAGEVNSWKKAAAPEPPGSCAEPSARATGFCDSQLKQRARVGSPPESPLSPKGFAALFKPQTRHPLLH